VKSPKQVLAEIEQLPPEQQAEALYYMIVGPLLLVLGRPRKRRQAH